MGGVARFPPSWSLIIAKRVGASSKLASKGNIVARPLQRRSLATFSGSGRGSAGVLIGISRPQHVKYCLSMQVARLEGFYWVARTGGYAAAARAFPYPLSQPAVFQQVRKLEKELGLRLFERVGKGELRLNAAGRARAQSRDARPRAAPGRRGAHPATGAAELDPPVATPRARAARRRARAGGARSGGGPQRRGRLGGRLLPEPAPRWAGEPRGRDAELVPGVTRRRRARAPATGGLAPADGGDVRDLQHGHHPSRASTACARPKRRRARPGRLGEHHGSHLRVGGRGRRLLAGPFDRRGVAAPARGGRACLRSGARSLPGAGGVARDRARESSRRRRLERAWRRAPLSAAASAVRGRVTSRKWRRFSQKAGEKPPECDRGT